jgi:ribose transport system permease protein
VEFLLTLGWDIVPSIIATLIVTTGIGALSGWLVAYLGMAPFIVTLCQSFNLQGWSFFLNRGMSKQLAIPGRAIPPSLQAFLTFSQQNDPILGIPLKYSFTLIFVVLTWFVMTRTKFGRLMLATGSNPVAARLAGIDIRKYRMAGFMIASFGCGLTGLLITGSTASSSVAPFTGDYTMIAMAATIIGGSSLEGGGGSVPFTIVGIFVMGLINNVMQLANVPAYPQYIVKAVIIILAIYMRSQVNRRISA